MGELKRYCELELDPYSPAKFRDPNGRNSVDYEGWPCIGDTCVIRHLHGVSREDLYDVAKYEAKYKFTLVNSGKTAHFVQEWRRVEL